MFFLHTAGKLSGIICYHVDDFLHAGEEYLEKIMVNLRRRLWHEKVEERSFNYIGFRIIQESYAIILDQSRYVENMKNKAIDPKRAQDKQSKLTSEEQTEYRQLIGQINWAVQGTRPDMAFDQIDLSTKLKEETINDLSMAIKAVNRLKDIRLMILFQNLVTISKTGTLLYSQMHPCVASMVELEVRLHTLFG